MFNLNSIKEVDVSYFSKYYDTKGYYSYMLADSGEHYKLLTHISYFLPDGSTVIDAGTCNGHSALALGQNSKINVLSYDIESRPIKFAADYPNITCLIQDVFTLSKTIINRAKVILLDIDPHNGKMEKNFLDMVVSFGYNGILLADDIHHNSGMEEFWKYANDFAVLSGDFECTDITEYGHRTGTGLITFH